MNKVTQKIVAVLGAAVLMTATVACSNQSRPPPAPVTTTMRIEVIPPVCLDALAKADKAFQTTGEGFSIASEIMAAAAAQDLAAMEASTAKLEPLGDRMEIELDAYQKARDACLAEKTP
jgi:hypothetical protein